MTFHLFNLKNPEDFLKGTRPIFEEIGPIVYREFILKENIMDNLNGTISYDERRYYEFRPDLSAYDEDFNMTTINLAPIVLMNLIKYYPDIAHQALNLALELTKDTLVVNKTVGELIWGYEDNLLHTLKLIADAIFKDLIKSVALGFFTGVIILLFLFNFCSIFSIQAV
jgi:hypothetical protein